jgi:hypothetical protein
MLLEPWSHGRRRVLNGSAKVDNTKNNRQDDTCNHDNSSSDNPPQVSHPPIFWLGSNKVTFWFVTTVRPPVILVDHKSLNERVSDLRILLRLIANGADPI